MKNLRRIAALLLCALLMCAQASAEDALIVRMTGNALNARWQTGGGGRCTLTLYMDDWPMAVKEVPASGEFSLPVCDAGHRFSARLKTSYGCLTALAVEDGAAGPEPTAPPMTPTPAPDITAAPAITSVPTNAPAVTPTQKPETPAPTAIPSSGTTKPNLASLVVQQVNAERDRAGLSALRVDSELTRAAQVRAREIAVKFSHTRPDGSAWSSVSASAYGENIAMGQKTVEKVMAAWMSSQGHRENILRKSYGSIGVCAYQYDGVMYWVQLFGR